MIIPEKAYNEAVNSIINLAKKAAEISSHLALLSTEAKNEMLGKIAQKLEAASAEILKANRKDIAAGKKKGLPKSLIDRLALTEARLQSIIDDIRKVATLKDHVGEIMESKELPNGLFLKRVRVPIGVIAMIYEARPNVTVDSAVLCLKSGNAVILKGGSDALNSNKIFVKLIQEALHEMSFLAPKTDLRNAVQLIQTTDREATTQLLSLREYIDVVIPRGGKGLIKFVREQSKIPVIETGASVVHTYIHEDADIKNACKIIMNAKFRRVSICNALDVLLLNKKIARDFLTVFVAALPKNSYEADHLEIRADAAGYRILSKIQQPKNFSLSIKKAAAADYSTEFLDYILAVRTVDGLDEALEHIQLHSLKHSEAIITQNQNVAQKFLQQVDAACVYWNTSTQFSDGGQFGLGAEIGISTQKLHVRGPFALEGLTSYKWVIEGNGQLRT